MGLCSLSENTIGDLYSLLIAGNRTPDIFTIMHVVTLHRPALGHFFSYNLRPRTVSSTQAADDCHTMKSIAMLESGEP